MKIFDTIKKVFKKEKKSWHHFSATSGKDKSGRYRYKVYIDGKLAKQECTGEFWFTKKNNKISIKTAKGWNKI